MFGFCWNCLKNDFFTNLGGFEWFLFCFILFNSFSPEKIGKLDFWDFDNSTNFKTPITREPQVQSQSTWMSLENLLNFLQNTLQWKPCLVLSFSRYCCSKVDWYYDPHSGSQGAKGLLLTHFRPMFHLCRNVLLVKTNYLVWS